MPAFNQHEIFTYLLLILCTSSFPITSNAQYFSKNKLKSDTKTEFYIGLRAGIVSPGIKENFLDFSSVEVVIEPDFYSQLNLGLAYELAPELGLHLCLDGQLKYFIAEQAVNFYNVYGQDYIGRWLSNTLYTRHNNKHWRAGLKIGLAEQLGPVRMAVYYGMDFNVSTTASAEYERWRDVLDADHDFLSSNFSSNDYPVVLQISEGELVESGIFLEENLTHFFPLKKWTYWSWRIEYGRGYGVWSIGGDHFWPISNSRYMRLGSRWNIGYTYYW